MLIIAKIIGEYTQ